jgi:hypothetical protein
MPKLPTLNPLFNNALQINIQTLKKLGYFEKDQHKGGLLTWSAGGNVTGEITFRVDTRFEPYQMTLEYNFKKELRCYSVSIAKLPSNLGKGEVLFFVCPKTGRLCRKLFSIGGYFYHRNAFKGAMYESQTQSKKMRFFEKRFGALCDKDQIYKQVFKKHLKKTYRGKPTKKYLKLKALLDKIENSNYLELEAMFLF